MSALHKFFSQRKKDLESGEFVSVEDTLKKQFKTATTETDSHPNRKQNKKTYTYHIAVQGCCHGELRRIYDACTAHEAATHRKIDLLVCCGDFQAIRNRAALASMAVPDRYKELGDFHLYAEGGRQRAPYLTVFVGGNHEDSDVLAQECYGGYVAPNIYYAGHSALLVVDGRLCLAGLSGIYKGGDYRAPYPPRPYGAGPEGGKRSAYHVREVEVEKLRCGLALLAGDAAAAHEHGEDGRLHETRERNVESGSGGGGGDGGLSVSAGKRGRSHSSSSSSTEAPKPSTSRSPRRAKKPTRVHLMVSHDWPVGITAYGNEAQLLRYKPFFADDIAAGQLGNPHTLALLRAARPVYYVAAHLHCKFVACVPLPPTSNNNNHNHNDNEKTTFLALDKCTQKGGGQSPYFIDFIDITVTCSDEDEDEEEGDKNEAETDKKEDAVRRAQPPGTAHGERISRHPRWVQVLAASHPYVARNVVAAPAAREGEGGAPPQQSGFSAARTAEALLRPPAQDADQQQQQQQRRGQPLSAAEMEAAQYAPTTAALLQVLGLPPALPLQLQPQAHTHTTLSALDHRQRGDGPQKGVPPVSAPSAAPDNTERKASAPLEWFTDV